MKKDIILLLLWVVAFVLCTIGAIGGFLYGTKSIGHNNYYFWFTIALIALNCYLQWGKQIYKNYFKIFAEERFTGRGYLVTTCELPRY